MPPPIPYPIDGNVKDVDGTNANKATVEIYNLRNGEIATDETDSDGIYIIDLANSPDFSQTNGDRLIIRAYKPGFIFKFDQRHAIIEGDALENQDLILRAENPRRSVNFKDLDEKQTQIAEHHPTADGKRIINVDEEGHPTITVAIDEQWDYNDTNSPVFIGEAKAGSKDEDPVWRIKKRLYENPNNRFSEARYADSGRFTQKWSVRRTLTYGP